MGEARFSRAGQPPLRSCFGMPLGCCYDSRAVLGGELAVPCNLQSAPAGLNSLPEVPALECCRSR